MERVLLWNPLFPHTRDRPISRTVRRAADLADVGWESWPPTEPDHQEEEE